MNDGASFGGIGRQQISKLVEAEYSGYLPRHASEDQPRAPASKFFA